MASGIENQNEAMAIHQTYQSPWKIKKILIEPDVALDRMFKFTKEEAEYIFGNISSDKVEKAKQGEDVRVKMVDLDTEKKNEFELSFMKVKKGQVYGFKRGWVTHFVVRRRLKVGEEIGIFVDQTSSKFYFSVLSRANVN